MWVVKGKACANHWGRTGGKRRGQNMWIKERSAHVYIYFEIQCLVFIIYTYNNFLKSDYNSYRRNNFAVVGLKLSSPLFPFDMVAF